MAPIFPLGMSKRIQLMSAVAAALTVLWCHGARGDASPQRLPSAVLVWPLIVVEGGGAITDTRVELVNLSRSQVQLDCTYVPSSTCTGFDFQVQLTPNQPISWLASRGTTGMISATAVPPFDDSGELKCIVEPTDESVSSYNTIQGRAAVFGADGQTIGYSAFGFLRLIDGPLTNEIDLDGVTYTQCPAEQHFVFIASDPSTPQAESELVLAPCSEDLENLVQPPTAVQFQIYNEFEEALSASISVTCSTRLALQKISSVFTRATLGSDTGHLIVKGVQSPILALVVDRFLAAPAVPATAGNEPALRGGSSAQIFIP
jgi:hypothetical protein